MNIDDYISPEEAAAIMDLEASSIRRYCRAGLIVAKKPGRDWLISRRALSKTKKLALGRPKNNRKNG